MQLRRFTFACLLAAAAFSGTSPVYAQHDVVGKVSVGYQGWYDAPGSNSQINNWWHYNSGYSTFSVDYLSPADYQAIVNAGQNGSSPAHGYLDFEFWPDMREIPGYATPSSFGNLGNGAPAQLFSSRDTQTVNANIGWMSHYGIDTVALQRFDDWLPFRNDVAARVQQACQTDSVKFYIDYCDGGTGAFSYEAAGGLTGEEADWVNNMSALTRSSAYARENGVPVVSIEGLEYMDPTYGVNTVNWFRNSAPWYDASGTVHYGCYVIVGFLASDFPTNADYASHQNVYKAANMVGDWCVGGFSGISGADGWKTNVYARNQAWCQANGVAYQPVIMAGSTGFNRFAAWGDNPRLHGDLMWEEFKNLSSLGLTSPYVAMWDEVSEGTQLIKTAEDSSMTPTRGWFQTLDADRIHVSSDFYLKLTGAGSAMLKGYIPATPAQPVPFMTPPAVWQSGFEGADPQSSPTPVAAAVGTDNVNGNFWQRTGENAHTGNNEFLYLGNVTANAQNQHNFYVRLFDLSANPIAVNSATSLSYWIRPDQDNARYAGVDLHFTDGTWLRNSGALDVNGFSVNPQRGHGGAIPLGAWTQIASNIGAYVSGKTIDGIAVGFDRPSASLGYYHGYIDDIAVSGVPDGVYTVSAAGLKPDGVDFDYNSVLDTNLHNNAAGTAVQLGYRLGVNSQKWKVHYQGNNTWDIRVLNGDGSTGNALSCAGGSPESKTPIQTASFANGAGQQWKIAAVGAIPNYSISTCQPYTPGRYCVLDGTGTNALPGTGVELRTWAQGTRQQQWMFSPAPGNANIRQIGTNIPVGKTISLQCVASNLYVTAADAATPLSATKPSITNSEQFRVYDQGNSNIALNAMSDHCNVIADNGGANPLIANHTSVFNGETFTWIANADGTVSLLALDDNKYVSANNSGGVLIANAAAIGSTEKFRVTLRNIGAYAQIDCGGSATGAFAADAYQTGSASTSSTAASIDTTAAGAAPAAVYRTDRLGVSTYTIPVPQGSYPYTVKLHFAEIAYNAAGKRKFNVTIDGTQVLTDYDIFADAGAMNKAVVKTFQTTSDWTGTIAIAFTNGSADTPAISGIEVY